MAIPAPPGMQAWVRDITAKVDRVQRELRNSQAGTSGSRTPVSAAQASSVQSSYGATGGEWREVTGAEPLQISGENLITQRVKITVSGVCEGLRSDTAIASANGLMRYTLEAVNVNKVSKVGDARGYRGFGASFNYALGAAVSQISAGSYSEVVLLPAGSYTVRSEYLYRQQGANIAVRWSSRTLLIEPL
jgi:hypothetical protein